jgi:hypothetical protein
MKALQLVPCAYRQIDSPHDGLFGNETDTRNNGWIVFH